MAHMPHKGVERSMIHGREFMVHLAWMQGLLQVCPQDGSGLTCLDLSTRWIGHGSKRPSTCRHNPSFDDNARRHESCLCTPQQADLHTHDL